MQPWYEEKCKRALEELARLSETIHQPNDESRSGRPSREEELEYHLACAIRYVLVLATVSGGKVENVTNDDIDLIANEGREGFKKVSEKFF